MTWIERFFANKVFGEEHPTAFENIIAAQECILSAIVNAGGVSCATDRAVKRRVMATTIFVENLPSDITEDGLKDVFAQMGEVESVKIKPELLTLLSSHPQDYGIVEMALEVDAYRAINCFEGAAFKDRKIHVKEAYPLFAKAKNMFDHMTDGYQFSEFNPLASFERWKDQHKSH